MSPIRALVVHHTAMEVKLIDIVLSHVQSTGYFYLSLNPHHTASRLFQHLFIGARFRLKPCGEAVARVNEPPAAPSNRRSATPRQRANAHQRPRHVGRQRDEHLAGKFGGFPGKVCPDHPGGDAILGRILNAGVRQGLAFVATEKEDLDLNRRGSTYIMAFEL